MAIIDTHTHLYDLPHTFEALRDAALASVSDVVALGVDLASNKKHLELVGVRGHTLNSSFELSVCPRIHIALGLHPGNIKSDEIDPCFLFFRDVLNGEGFRPIAIGEAGLDFWYKWVRQDDVKKNEQRMVFQRHLDLAKEFDLPIVVHCRGAWRECLDMIVASGVKKAVFHWYSGPMDVLKDILDAGFLISGSVALEYSPDSRKAMEYVPLDRILVETDTPVRGWTPKYVWRTLKALCALKAVDEEKALAIVNANARAFFNI
jgi:TatD DNase family protein